MQKIFFALVVAALATTSLFHRAYAQTNIGMVPSSSFVVNHWQGSAYSDSSGVFQSCMVSSSYVSGTTLGFAVFPNGSVNIIFVRSDWAFKIGQPISGQLTIDQRYAAKVTGVATAPTVIKISFAPTDPVFENLARGYVMTIQSDAGNGTFKLTDSFRALALAKNCAQKYQAASPPAPNNLALQNWMTRNTWFNDPRYAEQARKATAIDGLMRAEGKDPTKNEYYAELDSRLRNSGVVAPTTPVTANSPPSVQPSKSKPEPKSDKPIEVSGTGFVVSLDGYVVTNNHVIGGCLSPISGSAAGESPVDLRLVSADSANDLALLKSPKNAKSSVSIRGVAIHPGDGVVAIGYPFYGILSSDFTVTNGIVSSLGGVGNDSRYLQISAPVQPGNSGGPLLDMSGNVVGVVSEKLDAIKVANITGSIPENINFAIKTGTLRDFLDKNNVAYQTAAPHFEVKISDMAAAARGYTMRISCTSKSE